MDNQHEITPAALHMENQSTGEVLMSTESSSKNETAAYKRWVFGTMLLTILAFVLTASITVYIDPFFHYHAPLKGYDYPQDEYPTNNERYLNDGITRHFTYDSIITGTSMTENFKVSEANRLFGAHFIKVPFAGSKYREDGRIMRAKKSDTLSGDWITISSYRARTLTMKPSPTPVIYITIIPLTMSVTS